MARKTREYEKYVVNMTQSAERDLNEIIVFIAENNPQTAIKIMERIQAKINTLDHFPNRGGYVPELLARNIKEYRQITEAPWKIIYKVDDERVNILAIIDSRRNLTDILIKKLLK
jgi:plasmid stabilization system protein ParE